MTNLSLKYALRQKAAAKADVAADTPNWHNLAAELHRLPLQQYQRFSYIHQPAMRIHTRLCHQLPAKHCLMSLARIAQFPATSHDILALARHIGCNPGTILFLRLFGLHDVFENGIDFLNRCEEVELFLREEQKSSQKLMLSPQG